MSIVAEETSVNTQRNMSGSFGKPLRHGNDKRRGQHPRSGPNGSGFRGRHSLDGKEPSNNYYRFHSNRFKEGRFESHRSDSYGFYNSVKERREAVLEINDQEQWPSLAETKNNNFDGRQIMGSRSSPVRVNSHEARETDDQNDRTDISTKPSNDSSAKRGRKKYVVIAVPTQSVDNRETQGFQPKTGYDDRQKGNRRGGYFRPGSSNNVGYYQGRGNNRRSSGNFQNGLSVSHNSGNNPMSASSVPPKYSNRGDSFYPAYKQDSARGNFHGNGNHRNRVSTVNSQFRSNHSPSFGNHIDELQGGLIPTNSSSVDDQILPAPTCVDPTASNLSIDNNRDFYHPVTVSSIDDGRSGYTNAFDGVSDQSQQPIDSSVALLDPSQSHQNDDQDVSKLMCKQVEYYFSIENLQKDIYLRSFMDSNGWIPFSLIYGFNRISNFGKSMEFLMNSVKVSPHLEVDIPNLRLRCRDHPELWPVPKIPSVGETVRYSPDMYEYRPMIQSTSQAPFDLSDQKSRMSPKHGDHSSSASRDVMESGGSSSQNSDHGKNSIQQSINNSHAVYQQPVSANYLRYTGYHQGNLHPFMVPAAYMLPMWTQPIPSIGSPNANPIGMPPVMSGGSGAGLQASNSHAISASHNIGDVNANASGEFSSNQNPSSQAIDHAGQPFNTFVAATPSIQTSAGRRMDQNSAPRVFFYTSHPHFDPATASSAPIGYSPFYSVPVANSNHKSAKTLSTKQQPHVVNSGTAFNDAAVNGPSSVNEKPPAVIPQTRTKMVVASNSGSSSIDALASSMDEKLNVSNVGKKQQSQPSSSNNPKTKKEKGQQSRNTHQVSHSQEASTNANSNTNKQSTKHKNNKNLTADTSSVSTHKSNNNTPPMISSTAPSSTTAKATAFSVPSG